ncbi:hypothetical protein NEUTE1DRAFT_117121 [Neurospora tetrasperma FGSC 2508]|uniref:Uncharacterized protein n=1 Tax=Neurospora tetrasperma (strain FGSC 2508 / ATCC MYA-4615 / P0657) TaxID=510951 RepID=F8MKH4_NEUT8|nr:uncharacterized protein NEUTE1DRAFT_117121 [Neurospora tetrasperma FGSC 2508]EGO58255.1 hypothetical protein NEUTE1DRAFT_117121 [Neurospora tetrasperma FGSC 2508]EGZ71429.1 hypothetical protein NEUTE2DRAFT_144487 [Neurospora tetrasperma FGSC 2509]
MRMMKTIINVRFNSTYMKTSAANRNNYLKERQIKCISTAQQPFSGVRYPFPVIFAQGSSYASVL